MLPARAVVFVPMALLIGCSSYGLSTSENPAISPFSPAADLAKVCVIRSGFPAPLYTTVVHDDGVLVGATRDDTYFCYLAEPGKHVIVSDGAFGTRKANLVAQAGQRYYLKQSWLIPAVRGHAVSWIGEGAALGEVQYAEYARLTEVPGSEALPEGIALAPALR
jgi:hypothetical protein